MSRMWGEHRGLFPDCGLSQTGCDLERREKTGVQGACDLFGRGTWGELMEYLLFSYPNCSNCEKLRGYLSDTSLDWQEYNLVQKESKMKIRDFLADIKRDESGCIIIPTLIALDDGVSKAVLNSQEELDDWLKLKG